ncbi:aminotransferase class V-fold PLP-dependent enzyme [Planctomycetota bacterium]
MKEKTMPKPMIQNFPQDIPGLPRRQFIKRMFGSAAAISLMPALGFAADKDPFARLNEAAGKLSHQDPADEAFWKLVQEHFLIKKDLIMLNAANLCPSPYPVQQMVFDYTRDIDADPSSINRGKFSGLRESARQGLADFLGADAEEIAITRNTSEGNNIVIGGLTFQPGDEVIIWDENHPTANVAWDVRAQRYGFTVKRVQVPAVFDDFDATVKPFRDALTPRTRVICFSHVSNVSGIALDAPAICRMARARGVLTHIDGAQTFGSHVVDLHDIGCDFYTGSSHKWFVGPKEAGVLYVRKENIEGLWPSIIGVGYPGSLKRGAQKFETLGQRDDACVAAMGKTVEFHNLIGKARVEQRIRFLADTLKKNLKKKIPNIKFHTPLQPEFSGGVVVFNPPGVNMSTALNTLYHEHNIGCAVFGETGIRMCPHIYNTADQIDLAAAAVAKLA